jgi:hypothetical protein
MKHQSPIYALLTASVLVAAGYPGLASAHTKSGSLGKPAGATDIYQITCSDDGGSGTPYQLQFQVLDMKPKAAPKVTAEASKKGSPTVKTTDPTDGDVKYSPLASVNGGPGIYTVKVYKSAKAAEIYTLQFHCMTKNNIHTDTNIITLQNQ